MTRVLIDAATQAQLHAPEGVLEVCDSTGQILGYFLPVDEHGTWSARSPFSDEEIQKRRQ